MREDFCGHEESFSRNPAFFDRGAEFGFSVVDLGTIEVVVAEIYGGFDGGDKGGVEGSVGGLLVPGRSGAIAELDGKWWLVRRKIGG
jgi:hypothetical protein